MGIITKRIYNLLYNINNQYNFIKYLHRNSLEKPYSFDICFCSDVGENIYALRQYNLIEMLYICNICEITIWSLEEYWQIVQSN